MATRIQKRVKAAAGAPRSEPRETDTDEERALSSPCVVVVDPAELSSDDEDDASMIDIVLSREVDIVLSREV